MKVNIVSHLEDWRERDDLRSQDALNIPASVPAFLALEKEGIHFTPLSSFLRAEDYPAAWGESARTVKSMLDLSSGEENPDVPNLIVVHAYSLFLLIAQLRLLQRALNAVAALGIVEKVTIEDPSGQDGESTLFFDALNTPFFHLATRLWAGDRGIRVSTVLPGSRGFMVVRSRSWRSQAVEMACLGPPRVRTALRNFGTCLGTVMRRAVSRVAGDKRMLFYLRQKGAALGWWSPGCAVDAGPVIASFQEKPAGGGSGFPKEVVLLVGRVLQGAEAELVGQRFKNHLHRTWARGHAVFSGFSRLLERLLVHGVKPAFLAASPFIDWTYYGYAAIAFRRWGLPVAGVQHGGNYGLMLSGGLPIAFTEGFGNLFFHWGRGCIDELSGHGVSMPMRWVQTGSLRITELKGRPFHPASRPLRRILYAPTYLSVMTTVGSNIPWDAYLPLFRSVCDILNSSSLEVWVKVLNISEMRLFPWEQFPRLTVLEKGAFDDYVGHADALIVDYVGSSPVYEALATDRPIFLYAGNENQRWDPDFLKALEERVHCFWDTSSYLAGLRSFVEDPESFLDSHPKSDGIGLRDRYFPSVGQKVFWQTVEAELFGGSDQCP